MSKTSNDIIAAFTFDKQLRWGMAKVNEQGIIDSEMRLGTEIEETGKGIVAHQLTDYVGRIVEKYPVIKRARRIGVSTIGAVDIDDKRMRVWKVPREGWEPPQVEKPLIEFNEVFSRAHLGLKYENMVVQNDATCAALAEWYWREDRKNPYQRWLYMTINEDGVNCGLTRFHQSYFNPAHPEMAHIFPRMHPDDPFNPEKHSTCPYHTFCFEGVASGASMKKRFGDNWTSNRQAWILQAYYIGQFCLNTMLAFSPDIIVLGGYVVRQNPDLVPMVRRQFNQLNAGYVHNRHTESPAAIDEYITRGKFGAEVNILGALALVSGSPGVSRLPDLVSVDGGRGGN